MPAIARTLRDAGLPGGFHDAAASVFADLERTDASEADESSLEEVLQALVGKQSDGGPTEPATN